MINYFALMELPQSFYIDKNQLDRSMRNLQSQHHPDLQHHRLTAEQTSAIINQAYQTLLHVDSRASHLLELQGYGQTLQNSIYDLDFLDEAMDFRIALDNADLEQLAQLQQKLASWLSDIETDFAQYFQEKLFAQAEQTTQKLKFLVKLEKDLSKKIDELSQLANQQDDDLYV